MATVQRYLNTASSGGDGTTNGTSGSTAAFASMSSAEANMGGSATDDYILDCCGTAADTSAVLWDFPTNITTGSITVRGNRSDGAGFYTGPAAISTSHYRLDLAMGGGFFALRTAEPNTIFDGIQLSVSRTGSNASAIAVRSTGGNFTVRKCRVLSTDGNVGIGIGTDSAIGNGTWTIENNLSIRFTVGIRISTTTNLSPTVTIQHNTVYGGSSTGILVLRGTGSGSGTYDIYANAVANTATNDIDVTGSQGTLSKEDNATEDATGEITSLVPADAWTSPGTSASSDFTVKNTSSALYNAVNPTRVTTDITDFTRDGTNHDVGAFEFQAGGGATNLVIADATHGHTTDGIALTQAHVLAVQDSSHAHAADNLALTQQHVLAVADASHGHSADNVDLTQQQVLAVADAAHGHAADNLALTQQQVLAVADSSHGHSADNLALTQAHVLAVADAAHGHAADNVALSTDDTLAVADATHAHAADNLALTQAQVLAVADAAHAHTADAVALTQQFTLAIQDATHAHSADGVTLSVDDVLGVADARHGHSADNLALTQAYTLTIADARHAHSADQVAFGQEGQEGTGGITRFDRPPEPQIQIVHATIRVSGGGSVFVTGHKAEEQPSQEEVAEWLITFAV